MFLKIIAFISLYFIIKHLLKGLMSEAPTVTKTSNKTDLKKHDIIDAEYKIIKEE
jgi:hypothetical protein